MSEYIVMPEGSCIPLHKGLTADHGVLSEPLAIGVYSVKTSVDLKGKSIAILGFGPIGMSVLLAARAQGVARIYVTDKIDERLRIAEKEKASLACNPLRDDIVKMILEKEPLGVDVVFECCGKQEAFDQGIDLLKPGSRIMVVGIPEFDKWIVPVDKTRRKELTIQYVRRQADCTEKSLDMILSGEIDVSGMVTHRFHFSRSQEAFELVASYRDGVMKAMIDFQ